VCVEVASEVQWDARRPRKEAEEGEGKEVADPEELTKEVQET
jgi:hypothetical protein